MMRRGPLLKARFLEHFQELSQAPRVDRLGGELARAVINETFRNSNHPHPSPHLGSRIEQDRKAQFALGYKRLCLGRLLVSDRKNNESFCPEALLKRLQI